MQYGRVERLYIDQDNRQVFIKFTEPVSALRVRPLFLSGIRTHIPVHVLRKY